MRGHLKKRGAYWYGVVDEPRQRGEPRRRKWHRLATNKSDADAKLADLIAKQSRGEATLENGRITVAEFLDRWLSSARRNLGRKTHERYSQIAEKHLKPRLGKTPLAKLTALQLSDAYGYWLEHGRSDGAGGLSPLTVGHFHRLLRRALRDAVAWKLVSDNVAKYVQAPRVQRREIATYAPDQIRRLLVKAKTSRFYEALVVLAATGIRRGECAGLRWTDIDFKARTLTVRRSVEETAAGLFLKEPKNGKFRVLSIPTSVADILRDHRSAQDAINQMFGSAGSGFVFTENDGSMLAPHKLGDAFRDIRRRAGLPSIPLHGLRHSHASLLLASGVHLKVTSARLGHSSIGITADTYTHLAPVLDRHAADAVDTVFRALGSAPSVRDSPGPQRPVPADAVAKEVARARRSLKP